MIENALEWMATAFWRRLHSNCWLPIAMLLLPAAANAYAARNVAGWGVGPMYDNEGSCMIDITFEGKGSSRLSVILNPDKGVYVVLSNSYWSVSKGDDLRLTYNFSSGSYSDAVAKGIGAGEFVSLFDEVVLNDFSKSTYLHVDRDAVPVDKLNLRGSAAAISELRRCVASIKAEAQKLNRDRKKFDHLPDDPFGN